MATPHACWVILVGSVPTSFRAKNREDLLPTFRQLQRTQPEAALRWFERGKVWESPDAAKAAARRAAPAPGERRPRRDPAAGPPRDKDWRPGGTHKDPRARYAMTRDEKRARFKKNLFRTDEKDVGSTSRERKSRRPPDDPFSSD